MMDEKQKNFKKPPKKYQPKGLSILYEDRDILVVDKISGLLTVSNDKVRDNTAFFLLNEYVRKGNSKSRNRVFIVHRLDRETSGVLVFAKSEEAKRFLQDEWQKFDKTYFAVVHGNMEEDEGEITSYLVENSAFKMYSVSDPEKGQFARTGYKVIKKTQNYSLLEVYLFTGKKNQIRVHLADKGCPVFGDKKYGRKESGNRRLALHSASLTLLHPHSKEKITFTAKIPDYFPLLLYGK